MLFARALAAFIAAGLLFPGSSSFAATAERQQTVKAGDATIHVTIRGQGEPIVFIPSLGRGVEDFDDLSKRLVAAGYQAVLPDPRGMGRSTGPLENITLHDLSEDVAVVIRLLGSGPVIVLGHAHGNRVARMLAADHPELVRRTILLAAGGMVPRSRGTDVAFRRVFDPSISEEDRLAAIQRSFFAKGNDAKVWQKGWNFKVAAAQTAAVSKIPLSAWWSGGSAPILVLQAMEDAIAVPENARRLAAEFPTRVTVIDIPNSGHAMLPEQPDKIADAIVNWLRRH